MKNTAGFTLMELILVFGIVSAFSGIIIIGLSPRIQKSSLTSTMNQVLADIQSQQAKAMSYADSFGIHFDSGAYTLFNGSNYNASDITNSVFFLPPQVAFSDIDLPSPSLVFNKVSGEVVGYSADEHVVTLKQETSGEQKTFSVNPYGIITSVQ